MTASSDPRNMALRIALGMVPGLTLSTARRLVEAAGSPERLFAMPERELRTLLGTDHKLCGEAYRADLLDRAGKEAEFVRDNGIRLYFCADPDYPRRLAVCDDAPVTVYTIGNTDLDAPRTIAVVGTRNCTAYGVETTRRLLADLAAKVPGLLVVSGLAYGIDITAHRTSLTEGLPTLGVVAHGLDTIYPAEHRDTAARMVRSGGGILSEYPSHTRIHRSNFLARNRIVAAMADAVIVIESDFRGGALSTARIASMYGRRVFAVPGRLGDTYSRGTNRLIADDTARILLGPDDLLAEMGWADASAPAKPEAPRLFAPLPPEQQTLLDFIDANPSATVNDICAALAIPFTHVQDTLLRMELDGVVVAVPGGRYAKI